MAIQIAIDTNLKFFHRQQNAAMQMETRATAQESTISPAYVISASRSWVNGILIFQIQKLLQLASYFAGFTSKENGSDVIIVYDHSKTETQ